MSLIHVIQETTNFSAVPVTSYSLAFSNPVTPGSSIHVMAATGGSTNTYTSLADQINGTYGSALDSISTTPGNQVNAHWKYDNTGAGTPNITVQTSISAITGLWIREIGPTSGLDAGKHAGLDQAPPGTATDGTTSGTVTPSTAPGLISALAGQVLGSDGFSVGTGFTLGVHGDNTMTESRRYTTTATAAGTFTDSNGGTGNETICFAAWFKEPAAAGGTNQALPLLNVAGAGLAWIIRRRRIRARELRRVWKREEKSGLILPDYKRA